MTNLSPAAQVVLDAAFPAYDDEHLYFVSGEQHAGKIAAAAIRAASDRMMDLVGDICHPKYLEGIEASSDFLDQIATELEALAGFTDKYGQWLPQYQPIPDEQG